jgi:phospholipid/cholesterol/gamma-HCH transport system permease protein
MSSPLSIPGPVVSPLAWVGRRALSVVTYLGAVALMLVRAARQVPLPGRPSPGWYSMLVDELSWMLWMGIPLSSLMHMGLGSFLALQSYYGGTFVDGTGAVVGVGLFRNIAPLMAGLTLAGLLGARITSEFRVRERRSASTSHDPPGLSQRTGDSGTSPLLPEGADIDRQVSARLAAAMLTGPVVGLFGASVGTLVGWRVATSLMGVSTHSFFLMFWDMLWMRDVVGLFAKGVAFGLAGAAFACHEGLRGSTDDPPGAIPAAAFRAVCYGALTIMLINGSWFVLFYHSGPAFGPTLLAPPTS